MDLGTISNKLKENRYSSPMEVKVWRRMRRGWEEEGGEGRGMGCAVLSRSMGRAWKRMRHAWGHGRGGWACDTHWSIPDTWNVYAVAWKRMRHAWDVHALAWDMHADAWNVYAVAWKCMQPHGTCMHSHGTCMQTHG
eukprot:355736-Chlamydomonas_euryale.AAC.15